MGMLQQLVHVLRKLDPQNNYWHGIVLDETTKALQQAGNDDDKAELLDEIARVFNSAIHYPIMPENFISFLIAFMVSICKALPCK